VDTGAPAGKYCDFAIHNVGTGTDNIIMFPDRTIDHIDLQIAHINVDIGFTLTETDHITEFTAKNGPTRDIGVYWHLRNADGKILLVKAGQLVISADTGEVLKSTLNINPDNAAVICTALGGIPQARARKRSAHRLAQPRWRATFVP